MDNAEFSNWAWDKAADQYYWHRFYSSQPDLNYDNPKVQEETLNIACFGLAFGVDGGLRADVVPYLVRTTRSLNRESNLPEVRPHT